MDCFQLAIIWYNGGNLSSLFWMSVCLCVYVREGGREGRREGEYFNTCES